MIIYVRVLVTHYIGYTNCQLLRYTYLWMYTCHTNSAFDRVIQLTPFGTWPYEAGELVADLMLELLFDLFTFT